MATQTISEMRSQILAKADADSDFRAQFIADPRSVISAEFGITIPEGFNVQVHEDSASTAHFILPRPRASRKRTWRWLPEEAGWIEPQQGAKAGHKR